VKAPTKLFFDSFAFAGSTVVYPYDDGNLPAIELGASIFVEENKNLWRASTEFNLTRFAGETDGVGIWDGENVIFTVRGLYTLSAVLTTAKYESDWWGYIKFLWRYGLTSPKRTQEM